MHLFLCGFARDENTSPSPTDDAAGGDAERDFQDGSFRVGHGDRDFAEGFIGDFLAGNGEHVGSAVRIVAEDELEGAGGFFGFVKQLGFGGTVLQKGEDGANIGQAPFHDDFVFPIKLLLAALRSSIEKDRAFVRIEVEADRSAAATLVGFIDGVVVRVGFIGWFR